MADVVRPVDGSEKTRPDLPRVVRTIFDVASRNWMYGEFVIVLPSGQRLQIKGREPDPPACWRSTTTGA